MAVNVGIAQYHQYQNVNIFRY